MSITSRYTLDYTTISPSSLKVQDPPGFTPTLSTSDSTKITSSTSKPSPVNLDALRAQKAWEVALAPAKSVPMQAFMMYMTGGGIQVFSVMSVWFLLKQAFAGILSVQKVFLPYTTAKPATPVPGVNMTEKEPQSFMQQKAVYLLCQLGLLGVGLWKLNSMGLLPTHESDWIHFGTYSEWKREAIDTSQVRHLMGRVRYQ